MKHVVLITTGGTIASRWQGSGYASDAPGTQVLATAALPDGVDVQVIDLFNVNSPRLTTAHQLELLRTVHATLARPEVAGVVVAHGTDTLEETAFLLDLHHGDERPVVLTGSQLPMDAAGGDGPGNLRDSLLTASSVTGVGTLVVFDGRVHAARGTVKTETVALNAFAAPSGTPLGSVGPAGVVLQGRPERPSALPLPPQLPEGTAPYRVDLVMHHADADPALLRAALAAGAQGVVLVATGAGNATPQFVEVVAEATARGVLVALTTRVPSGPVTAIYTEGGAVDLIAAGAQPTGTLRAGQARMAVLAALLGSTDPQERRRLLAHALAAPDTSASAPHAAA
ncbi:asparaginase [Kitasatospora sp. NPDC054939]